MRAAVLVAALGPSIGCGEDWPIVVGGSASDQVLTLAAGDGVIVAGGVGDKIDAPSGRVILDGFSADASHLWSLAGTHDVVRGIDAGGLAGAATTIPDTSDVIIGGEFAGSFELAGLGIQSTDEPGFERLGGDLWLARITATTGEVAWIKALGGPAFDAGISVDASATEIVVAGRFHEQIDLGGGPLRALDGPGAMPGFAGDVFVAAFDLDGTHVWSRSGGGVASDSPGRLRVGATGEVTVVGSFALQANLGGADLVSQGSGDIFIARYAADGSHLWSTSFGGPDNDAGTAVALDGTGRIAVGGLLEGDVDLGGGPLRGAGLSDGFVALYDSDGAHLWSLVIGGAGRDLVTDVTIANGFVIATGKFEETLQLDVPRTSHGGTDGFVVWLDLDSGAIVKSAVLGGSSSDGASSLATSSVTYVGGFFSGDASLNGSATSHGDRDGFVTRF